MPRVSRHAGRKPEVLAEFEKGLKPIEVLAIWPDLPTGTVYDWHGEWRDDIEETERIAKGLPSKNSSNVVPLFGESGEEFPEAQNDFEFSRRLFRLIGRNSKMPGGVRVQAGLALLKCWEVKASAKYKGKTGSTEDEDWEEVIQAAEEIDYDLLSDEELEKLVNAG